MTSAVEAALAAATAAGQHVDLDALGPYEEVAAEVTRLAATPAAPLAAAALAAAVRHAPGSPWSATAAAFARHLAAQRSLLALVDSVDTLLEEEPIATATAAPLHAALIDGLDSLVRDQPLLAAARVEAVLRVALAGAVTPYRVLDRLTTIDRYAPAEYAEALPRLIGAALDAWAADAPLTAPLLDTLASLGGHLAADADAAFELACHVLRTALRGTDSAEAATGLARAADMFDAAEALDEARDDAAAYAAVCHAVTAFASGDRDTLEVACTRLETVLARRGAWHFNAHLAAWRRPVRNAETEWLALVLDLRAAANRLADRSWLDTAAAVGQIARVYTAERATAPAPGLTAIVKPAVENAFTANAVLLDQLARAVEQDRAREQPVLPFGADLILAAVRRRRAIRSGGDAEDEEDDPAADDRISRLAPSLLQLGPAVYRVLATLNDAHLAELGDLLATVEAIDHSANPILGGLRQEIIDQVAANPRFRGKARAAVVYLLDRTLTFLLDRYDRGGPLLPGRADIIGLVGEDDRMPVEADLQYEFYIWLAVSSPLAGRVHVERSHVATGRVDVTARVNDLDLVTEVKRELHDSSRESLQRYVPQTAQYSGSTEPFSQLLVLDLTDHSDGVRPLRDLVWVVEHRADPGASPQHVVVAVVIGNRPTPRQLTDRRTRRTSSRRRRDPPVRDQSWQARPH